jgi:hypothetical protein
LLLATTRYDVTAFAASAWTALTIKGAEKKLAATAAAMKRRRGLITRPSFAPTGAKTVRAGRTT